MIIRINVDFDLINLEKCTQVLMYYNNNNDKRCDKFKCNCY